MYKRQHYGAGNGNFRVDSSRPLTPADQKELKDYITKLDIPLVKYETATDANGATVKMDGPWAGLRAGLIFGYRF